ncbi:MAG: hypothetical protein MN733_27080 [Nitrososphaera sp.]|nr:hypothetical protein [Nitrososphaera sp.]
MTILPSVWVEKLQELPDSGKGYKDVVIEFLNGKRAVYIVLDNQIIDSVELNVDSITSIEVIVL